MKNKINNIVIAGFFILITCTNVYSMQQMQNIEKGKEIAKATQANDKEGVQKLLAQGVRPDEPNEKIDTALHYAALNGNIPMLKLISQWQNGQPPFEIGLKGINLNVRNSLGQTPLYLAVEAPNAKEVIKYLFNSFAHTHLSDPNIQTKKGATALHRAVALGKTDIIDLLMQHGANPYIKNEFGNSPIEDGIYIYNKDKKDAVKNAVIHLFKSMENAALEVYAKARVSGSQKEIYIANYGQEQLKAIKNKLIQLGWIK